MLTTPLRITADIRRLVKKLGNVAEPRYVDVKPLPNSIPNNCFPEVLMHVEKVGGDIQHGWTIWEFPGLFAEAEFHAVWKPSSGQLVDITVKKDGERKILFVPDLERLVQNRRVPMVRYALNKNPLLLQWITAKNNFDAKIDSLMGANWEQEIMLDDEGVKLQTKVSVLQLELANQMRRSGLS